MFTRLHIKLIRSLRPLVALVSGLNARVMMFSAPVCGRLLHVSQLTAPVDKLATGAVHGKVAPEQLNADESRSSYLSPACIAK